MTCKCGRGSLREFPTEVNVHFLGKNALHTPSVLIFPSVLLCLECGHAEMTVAESDLEKLKQSDLYARAGSETLLVELPRTIDPLATE
jgi:hypothetical protein